MRKRWVWVVLAGAALFAGFRLLEKPDRGTPPARVAPAARPVAAAPALPAPVLPVLPDPPEIAGPVAPVVLGGPGFLQTYDQAGLKLESQEGSLGLALRDLRIGDTPLLAEGWLRRIAPGRRSDGSEVSFDRGHVVEKYIPSERAVEQVFVLGKACEALRGGGDLSIRLGLESPLEAVAVGEGRPRIEFRNPGGGAVFTMGEATAIDARGRRKVLAYALRDGDLEMTLEAGFLSEAEFPLVVDPLIGTTSTVDSSGFNSDADAVFSPGGNEYLIVYDRRVGGSEGNILSRTQFQTGPFSAVVTLDGAATEDSRSPKAAASGTNQVLVVWQERIGSGTWSIKGRFVTVSSGAPVLPGTEFTISTGFDDINPDVGFSTTAGVYLVAWERVLSASNHDIHGVTVGTDGTVGAAFAIDAPAGTFEERPTVTRTLLDPMGVAWVRRATPTAPGDILACSVDVTPGSAFPPVILAGTAEDESDPDLGSDLAGLGQTFLVWSRTAAGGDVDILGTRVVFFSGSVSGYTTFTVQDTGTTRRPRVDCSYSSTGTPRRAVVVYAKNATYPATATAWGIEGTVFDINPDPPTPVEVLSLNSVPRDDDSPAVALNLATLTGTVAWTNVDDASNQYIMAQRLVLASAPVAYVPNPSRTVAVLEGGGTASQNFNIYNIGVGTLNWTATPTVSWLTVGPTSGALSPSGFVFGTLIVDPTGLSVGSHTGTIEIADPASLGSPRLITVNALVTSIVWVSPPTGSYTSGSTIPFSWGYSIGAASAACTQNLVQRDTSSFFFTPFPSTNQPGPPGTYSGSMEAPVVGSPTTYYFRPQLVLDGSTVYGPVVTATINPPTTPLLSLNATSLTFVAPQGGPDPTSSSVTLTNTGIGTLNWSANYSAGWLRVLPDSGALAANQQQALSVSVRMTGYIPLLTPGVYSETVTVSDAAALNSPKTFTVNLTVVGVSWVAPPPATAYGGDTLPLTWNVAAGSLGVSTQVYYGTDTFGGSGTPSQTGSSGNYSASIVAPAVTSPRVYYVRPVTTAGGVIINGPMSTVLVSPRPAISLNPTTLSFGADPGVNPPAQSVTVSNTGGGTLNWTATPSVPWLTPTPAGGAVAGGSSQTLSLSADVSTLAPGVYSATVAVADPAASNSPRTIQATLTVAAVAWVIPPSGTFLSGQPIPFSWSVAGGSWNSTHSDVHYGTTNPPPLSTSTADQSGPSGTFSDSILAPPVSVPTTYYLRPHAIVALTEHWGPVASVTVNPSPTPTIALTPSSVVLQALEGSTVPTSLDVTVENVGGGTLNWTASSPEPWLSESPASGSLGIGPGSTLTLTVDPTGLPIGQYTGTVNVGDPAATNTPQTVTVTLHILGVAWVTPPAASYISGDPINVSWTLVAGPWGAYSQNGIKRNTVNPPWFGFLEGNQPGPSGVYSAILTAPAVGAPTTWYYGVESAGFWPLRSSVVAVTINPRTTPLIGISTTGMTFTGIQGAANPPAQPRTLQNTGGGTLNWTASSAEAWLLESPSSGSLGAGGSTTLNVSVNTTGLAAGSYTGSVVVSDPAASNSPRTIPVTLNVLARPPNDDFANRIVISGDGVTATGTNVNATQEAGEPVDAGLSSPGQTVWWSWTAPSTGSFSVNTIGSTFDTILSVYTGASLAGLSLVASNDTDPLNYPQSNLTLSATSGTVYTIRVDGYSSYTGSIVLTIASGPRIGAVPASLSFVAGAGAVNPPTQVLRGVNVGLGSLDLSVATDQPWLGATPATATLAAAASQSLTVGATTGGLTAGVYAGNVQLSSPSAANSPLLVPVTFTVTSAAWTTPPGAGYHSGETIPAAWELNLSGLTAAQNRVVYSTQDPPWFGTTTANQPGGSGSYSAAITAPSVNSPTTYYFAAEAQVSGVMVRSAVVPVLILPQNPYLWLVYDAMTFAGPSGGPNPPAQKVQVMNDYGSVSWTAAADVPWIGLSPTSGTNLPGGAPQFIQVSVNLAGLAAGSHSGTLTLMDSWGLRTDTMAVTLVVGGVDWAVVPSGSYASGQAIPLAWTVSAGTETTSHNSVHYGWTNPPGAGGTTADQPGPSGSYFGTLVAPAVSLPTTLFLRPHATFSGGTIEGPVAGVTITPAAAPAIGLSTTSLAFTSGGSQPVTLSNAGSGTLNWSAAEGVSWLSIASPPAGSLPAGAAEDMWVSANPAGLTAGTYAGVITVSDPAASNSPRLITVTLTVTDLPAIVPTPGALTFTASEGGLNPPSQTVSLQYVGSQNLDWVSSSSFWLSVSPDAGRLPPGASQTITISCDILGLTAGTYSGGVWVGDLLGSFAPVPIPVTLQILPPAPFIRLSKSSLGFTAVAGGPTPSSQQVGLTNAGTGTLNWAVIDDAPWLTQYLSSSAPLVAGASETISVYVNLTGMSPGVYTASLSVTDPAASNSPATIPVTLTLRPALPSIALSPAAFTFEAVEGGGAPASQVLTVANPGDGTLSWTSSDTASWLSQSPAFGSLTAGVSESVRLLVNPAGLVAGTYTTQVQVSDSAALNSPQTVDVTLNVAPPGPRFALSPPSLTLGAAQGGASPGVQTVLVTNVGTATLDWTAMEDSPWMSVLPLSGSLPPGMTQSLSVDVDVSGLGTGTYAGTVRLSAAGATNSPQDVPVTLTVAAVSWIMPPLATYASGDPISVEWNVQAGSAGTTGTAIHYSTLPTPWFGPSAPPSQNGSSGSYRNTFAAPSVTVPTNYTFGAMAVVNGAYVYGPIATVTLTPTPPRLSFSTGNLSFIVPAGSTTPVYQTVNLTNTGGGTLAWTTSAGPSFTLMPSSGYLPAGYFQTVTVKFDPTGYTPGETVTFIGFNSPGNATQYLQVTVTAVEAFMLPNAGAYTTGDTITFDWDVNAGSQFMSYNQVYWYFYYPPFSSGQPTPNQPGFTGSYKASMLAPRVTTPTVYYFGARVQVGGTVVTSPVVRSFIVYPPGTPSIALSPTTLYFSATIGNSPPAASAIAVRNDGVGTLAWTATPSAAWILPSPPSGSVSGGSSQTLNVSVNPAGLAVGEYVGTVSIADPAAPNSPQLLTVVLRVTQGPGSATPPPNDNFANRIALGAAPVTTTGTNSGATGEAGESFGSTPVNSVWWTWTAASNGTVVIDTAGSDFDTYLTIFTGTGYPLTYVTTDNDSGPGSTSRVYVNVTAGTAYHIQVDGYADLVGSITLNINPQGPRIELDTAAVTLYAAAGTTPSSQNVMLTNSGTGTLNWSASSPQAWLTMSPSSGTRGQNFSGSCAVTANPTGLPAGTYGGTLTISDPLATNNPQSIAVTLHVVALTWVTPPSGTYRLGEPIPFTWHVEAGSGVVPSNRVHYSNSNPPWFSSPTSSQPGPSGDYSDVVTLPLNTVTGTWYFGARAIIGGVTVDSPVVSVTMTTAPTLSVGPISLAFSATEYAANPATQDLAVSNTGTGSLFWTATEGIPWLSLSPLYGTAPGTTTASVDISGMPAGTYSGSITVESIGSLGTPRVIPVTLTLDPDTVPPALASLASTSADGVYGSGASLNVTVNFSEPVALTGGNLLVALNSGAVVSIAPFGFSSSAAGTYVVAPGQNAADLSSTGLSLAGGASLLDQAGNAAVLTIPAGQNLGDSRSIVIDTAAPGIASVTSTTADGTYGLGAPVNVTVNFTEAVTLSGGNLVVTLDTGGAVTIAPFTAQTTVSGTYTVAAGQNSADLTATSPLTLSAGTLVDAAGNAAVLTIPAGQNLGNLKAIVIDTTAPGIASVTSTTADGTYGLGAPVNVTVNFTEAVTLAGGNLQVTLDTGDVVSIAPFGPATSASATYTVGTGDTSADLTAGNPLTLSAGTLLDAVGLSATLSIPAGQNLGNLKSIVIDTAAPGIASVTSTTADGTYGLGAPVNVTVNFTEAVTLAVGNLQVTLDTGDVVSIAPFGPATSASATYTVGAGDNSADLTAANPLTLSAGTLVDAAGNAAILTIPAGQNLGNLKAIVIDTAAPGIASVTSTTADGTYGIGAPVNVTVNFTEAVTLTGGSLEVTLDTGDVISIAPFGPAASASATYTVGAGDTSADLTAASPLTLSAGTLVDAVGLGATLTIPAGQNLGNLKSIVVDTAAPGIASVTSTTADGTYGIGAPVNVTVNFTEAVTLSGGNLLVTLDTGDVVSIAPFGPATSASATYTVGAGDNSADLTATSPLTLSAGTLVDAAGNAAVLTIPAGQNLGNLKAIVIDTAAPGIASVTSTTADGTYGVGAPVNVTVNFTEPVTLAGGFLQVTLDTGDVVSIAPFGPAASASATYTVGTGDNSADLTAASPLTLSAGTLVDAVGLGATLTIPAGQNLGNLKSIVVDTTAPGIASVTSTTSDGTYGVGAPVNVTVTFTEAVTLAGGNLLVTLDTGDVISIAPFGPATSATATYTVGAGDNSPDLTAANPLTLSGGTLQDGVGNGATLTIPAGQNLGNLKAIVIDTAAPGIASVTSTTADGAYGLGAPVNVTVTFTEAVTLAGGNLLVTLDTGDVISIAPFGPATSATATYTVGAGDNSPDLTAASPLTLSGGTLQDAIGNNATLGIPAGQNLGNLKAIAIDTAAPGIASVTSTTADGTYGLGAAINVTVNFTEMVTLAGGNLQVTLDTGDVVSIAPFGPAASASATYTVGAGDTSADLASSSPLTLTGGTLADAVGLGASLAVPAGQSLADLKAIVIDTTAPAIASVSSTTADGTYGLGAPVNVTVTFTGPVTLAGGNLVVALNTGGTVTIPPFSSSSTASGTYTVAAGHNSPDLTAASPLTLSGGTLQDAGGNSAILTVPAGQNIADLKSIVVDTAAPGIASVTSTTADGTYGVGAPVNVTVNFTEAVTLAGGNLQVALDTGDVISIAPFGPASSASATYTVGAGDSSADLTAASPLTLSAGTLVDAVGLNAALTIPAGQSLGNLKAIVIDTTAPGIASVTSTTADGTYGLGAPVDVTVNFSEAVTLGGGNLLVTLDTGDVISIAPFGPAASASATYTVGAGDNSADLTAGNPLALSAGTLADAAGNGASLTIPAGQNLGNLKAIAIDTTAPGIASVTSTTADGAYGLGVPVNVTVNFTEPVTLAGGNLLVTLDTGDVVSIAPFGPAASASATYTVGAGDSSADLAAASPLTLSGGTLADAVGLGATLAVPAGQNLADLKAIVIDTAAPTVTINQGSTQLDPTNVASIVFDVLFSEPVTGFAPGDVALTGPAGAVASVGGTGAAYTVTVSGMTADGTVTVSIAAGAAQDAAGNLSQASTTADNQVAYDSTSPQVTVNQAGGQLDPTNVPSIVFDVVFTQAVTGFTAADVALAGPAGATASVSGIGATYTVTVSGMTADGTVTVSIPAGAAQDAAGNLTLASTSTDNAATYDATGPGVIVNQSAGQPDPTGVSPVSFTAVFNEVVTGFGPADVTIGGTAGATTAAVSGTGTTYTILVSGMTGAGTVTVAVAAAAAQDAAGNNSLASTSTDASVTYDTAVPSVASVTSAAADGVYAAGAGIPITITFSEPVTLSGGNLLVTLSSGATLVIAPFASQGNVTATYVVGPGENAADLTALSPLTLSAGATLLDGAGNPTTLAIPAGQNLGDSRSIVVDTTAPSVAGIGSTTADGNYPASTAIDVTVTFSEPVTLAGGNLLIALDTGAVLTIAPFASSLTAVGTYTVAAGDDSPDLNVTSLSLGAGATLRDAVALDASLAIPAGQNLADARSIVVDTTAPVIAIASPPTGSAFGATPVTVGGTATDNRGVTSVTWTRAPGGASGTATYAAPGFTASVTLVVGGNTVTLTAQDAAGNTASDAVALTYTPPAIGLGATTLTFAAPQGGPNPSSQDVTVSNAGLGTLSWSASDNQPWCSVAPASGALSAGASQAMTVMVDVTGLAAGSHTATLQIDAPGASNTPRTITVQLTVNAAPVLLVSPAALAFDAPAGGPNPPPQALAVTNAGAGTMTWTATEPAGWLALGPAGGSLGAGASQSVNAVVDVTGLPAGTYTTTITVNAGGAGGQSVPVTLNVNAVPKIGLSPSAVTIDAPLGGPNPAGADVVIANAGTGTLGWSATDDAAWLAVSPASGSLGTGAFESMTLSADVTGLPAGTYTATVTVTAPGASNSPQTLTVTLNVNAMPTIGLDPGSLTFDVPLGSTAANSQSVAVTNTGTGTLAWGALDNASWLSLSPPGGSVGAGLGQGMLVTVDPTGLAAGTYTATVTVTAGGASNSPQTVGVTLNVNAGPVIDASPVLLSFTGSGSRSLTITNAGAGTLNWALASGASWLTVSSAAGSLGAGLSGTVSVSADASALAPGTYSATLTLSDGGASNSPQAVFVTLRVAPAGPLVVTGSRRAGACGATGLELLVLAALIRLLRRRG